MKLWQKFLAASLLIGLGPLLWLGVRLIGETNASLRDASFQLQKSLADRSADSLRNELENLLNLLTVLGRSLNQSPSPQAAQRILSSTMNIHPILTDVWVYDAAGRERLALHRAKDAKGLPKKAWPPIKKAIQRQGYYLGPATFTEGAFPRLISCVPLVNAVNKPEGFLAARANLYVLSDVLRKMALGPGARAFLVDQGGRILAQSSPGLSMEKGVAAPSHWLKPDWSQGRYKSFDGQDVLGVKTPLEPLNAFLVFERSAKTALETSRQVRRRVLRAVAFATGFAVLLSVVMSGFIVRPLKQLREAIQKMESGKFDALITFDARDEIGDIARALRRAQPVLEKRARDSVLGKMARFIGHDLRQLVQAQRNSLAAILKHVTAPDANAAKHFLLSYETLDWMDDFIEDMLTVGRDRPLACRPVSLNEVVRRLLPKLKAPDGCEIKTALADGLAPCPVDEKEARKAILNAAKNALEALDVGGQVTIGTAAASGGVTVFVQDDGGGIPEEKRARLFEESTTKEHGSGLGLLVMKKVMDQHGGRLEIDSAPGQGTTVRLFFPQATAAGLRPEG